MTEQKAAAGAGDAKKPAEEKKADEKALVAEQLVSGSWGVVIPNY